MPIDIGFGFRWRPRLLPFIAALLAVALGMALGQWQTARGDQKQALANQLAQRAAQAQLVLGEALNDSLDSVDALEYRRVALRGTFMSDWTIYLENRPHDGVAGFYVMTPMRIGSSDTYVLVARGWTARNSAERSKLPLLNTPSGEVALQGVMRRQAGRLMQLGQAAPLQPQAIVQNLTVAELAAASGLRLQPFIIEQSSALDDGLIRDWPQASLGIERHRGYAFQWYALALMAALFFVFTGFRREEN